MYLILNRWPTSVITTHCKAVNMRQALFFVFFFLEVKVWYELKGLFSQNENGHLLTHSALVRIVRKHKIRYFEECFNCFCPYTYTNMF